MDWANVWPQVVGGILTTAILSLLGGGLGLIWKIYTCNLSMLEHLKSLDGRVCLALGQISELDKRVDRYGDRHHRVEVQIAEIKAALKLRRDEM
jgi:hypothetical protein